MKNISLCVFALLCGGLSPVTATPISTWTMALSPDAVITGPAGSTIGWGYTITNESTTQWLVMENLAESPLQNVSSLDPVFDYPILAPGAIVTEDYSEGSSGLLGLTWSSTAPIYFVNTGNFIVSADWFNGDPSHGGADAGPATAEMLGYTAQVGPMQMIAPEPATAALCGGLLVMFCLLERRRSHNHA